MGKNKFNFNHKNYQSYSENSSQNQKETSMSTENLDEPKNTPETESEFSFQQPEVQPETQAEAQSETQVNENTTLSVAETTDFSLPVSQPPVSQPTEVNAMPVTQENQEKKEEAKKVEKEFTPVYKIELDLVSYAEAMDRTKSIVPEEGGKWQYSLFNTIRNILNAKTQEEFNAEFNTVLNFFNKNKDGIFNEKFIFRFPEYWPGSENEFVMFRRLIYLIIQTADPKQRKKALESINLETVTNGLTEDQKQKLFHFYL